MYIHQIENICRPKVRARGWKLNTAGSTNHHVNSGIYGAGGVNSASWDQHGQWFAMLYAIDPRARIAIYESADDFHAKTKGKYRLQPITAERYDGEMIELPPGIKLAKCGVCGWCHPQTFNGDCRQDNARFHSPENYDDVIEYFDDNDDNNPDAGEDLSLDRFRPDYPLFGKKE
jgi:hypothetical protein